MTRIGYHASHGQHGPRTPRDLAEAGGFAAVKCSDRIQRWSTRQGRSGHVWAWLGATMVPFGNIAAPLNRP